MQERLEVREIIYLHGRMNYKHLYGRPKGIKRG